MTTHKNIDTFEAKTGDVAAWGEAGVHKPVLPSGFQPKIRIPDLPRLIETGEIPQHLLDAALGVAGDPDAKPTKDLIVQQREFTDKVTQLTVIEPALNDESVLTVPFEDKEMIVAFATRQRDLDALGDHLAGLTKSEKFRAFRRLGEFDPDVAGL